MSGAQLGAPLALEPGMLSPVSEAQIEDRVAAPVGASVHYVAAAIGDVVRLQALIDALEGRKLLAIERARRAAAECEDRLLDEADLQVGRASTVRRRELAERAFTADLATALRVGEPRAGHLVDTARVLARSGAATLVGLCAGRFSLAHAIVLGDVLDELPDPDASDHPDLVDGVDPAAVRAAVQTAALPAAPTTTLAQFRTCARRARDRAHPVPLVVRHERAADKRAVHVDPAADGMAWLTAYLPAAQAHAAYDRLTKTARTARDTGDPRTLTQLRADTLSALLLAGRDDQPDPSPSEAQPADPPPTDAPPADRVHPPNAREPGPGLPGNEPGRSEPGRRAPGGRGTPGTGGVVASAGGEGSSAGRLAGGRVPDLAQLARRITPRVQVTVPVLSLLDHSDHPAELAGHGPIDPVTATLLTANAPSLRRLLVDPDTGQVLSTDPGTYSVPAALRAFLEARDGRCRFPGCTRPVARCDVDHTTAWADGGRTTATNLAHLCRRHHVAKHQTGWDVTAQPDGTLTWTSPTGRVHHDPVAEPVDLTGPELDDVARWARDDGADVGDTLRGDRPSDRGSTSSQPGDPGPPPF
ncbi:hypothetical protein GCM10009809_03610 [Isoptericola hypogeus]|uniref:HNH nuclease domain-containing protein n=1 Tax=Isoptericola hypogeus TaxID=300179 RepID=A0ABN2IRY5_9MICO